MAEIEVEVSEIENSLRSAVRKRHILFFLAYSTKFCCIY